MLDYIDGINLIVEKDGIEIISTEFFTDPGQPVIWRGSMLNSMLSHFFYDTKWHDDTEYIIIDFPPGTGDILLDVKNIVLSFLHTLSDTHSKQEIQLKSLTSSLFKNTKTNFWNLLN